MSNQNTVKALPFFFVGKDIARKRIEYFMSGKYPVLTENDTKPETRSTWYSFEHIKALCEELEYLGASGLRIYLGTYLQPGNEEESSLVQTDATKHAAAAGQISLLMVPTRAYLTENNDPRHTDLIIEDEPGFEERLMGITLEEFINSKPYNAGSPCPPACFVDDTKFP